MKHWLSFLLFVPVSFHAQDASKPTVQPTERGAGDYYGAYASNGEPVFNHNPNAFLVECVRNRKPCKALWGWVQAEIPSIQLLADPRSLEPTQLMLGLRKLGKKAKKSGVRLNAIVKSDTDFDFGTKHWDLIVVTYQPFRELLPKLKPSLKEGGIVVIENFNRDTMRDRLLDEDAVYRNNEPLELFSDFRILRYEDTVAKPDWGIEFPKNRLVRLEAQKGDIQRFGCDWKGVAKPRRRRCDGER